MYVGVAGETGVCGCGCVLCTYVGESGGASVCVFIISVCPSG